MATDRREEYLVSSDVAEWLLVSEHTLSIWRSKGKGPKFVRLNSKLVRYARSAVEAYLKAQTMGGTKGAA